MGARSGHPIPPRRRVVLCGFAVSPVLTVDLHVEHVSLDGVAAALDPVPGGSVLVLGEVALESILPRVFRLADRAPWVLVIAYSTRLSTARRVAWESAGVEVFGSSDALSAALACLVLTTPRRGIPRSLWCPTDVGADPVVRRACDLIPEVPRVRVQDLAAALGVERHRLNIRFRAAVGRTAGQVCRAYVRAYSREGRQSGRSWPALAGELLYSSDRALRRAAH